MARYKFPHEKGKNHKSETAHGCACRIYACCFSAARRPFNASLFFFLLFVFLNQCCAGGKNRRKSKEQPTDAGTELFSNYSGDSCDEPPNEEPYGVVVPFRLHKNRRINFDPHSYFRHRYHVPNAIPNHKGIALVVIKRALRLCRIMIQLTKEA